MINSKRWPDLLSQQYSFVTNSERGHDLLLAVRKFVAFLDSDLQAQRYIKKLDYQWERVNIRRRNKFNEIRSQALELEQRIKVLSTELDIAIRSLPTPPDTPHNDLSIFKESDLSQKAVNEKDDLEPELVYSNKIPQTQTGYICNHVYSFAQRLSLLAKSIDLNQEAASELYNQADVLLGRYISERQKLNNDWMSSGQYALEQLYIVVEIIDGELFVNPDNFKFQKMNARSQWKTLMLDFAPRAFNEKIKNSLFNVKSDFEDFERDVQPLIRRYLRRVFEDLHFLANSRLTHQHLVEQYKVRCENYDWKHIGELIKDHAERVQKKGKRKHEFEDLLTLHFARYLHDNGYAVHYTLRDGVHEPDLLGDDLEPIVVEAKVVGQMYRVAQREDWILQGLRALLAYLHKYHSDYNVTDGYLIVFRMGDKKFPMYTFDPAEWGIGQFTIVPKMINIGEINKKDPPVLIKQEDFLKKLES